MTHESDRLLKLERAMTTVGNAIAKAELRADSNNKILSEHDVALKRINIHMRRIEASALTEEKMENIINGAVVSVLKAILVTAFVSASTVATAWLTYIFGIKG